MHRKTGPSVSPVATVVKRPGLRASVCLPPAPLVLVPRARISHTHLFRLPYARFPTT